MFYFLQQTGLRFMVKVDRKVVVPFTDTHKMNYPFSFFSFFIRGREKRDRTVHFTSNPYLI